MQAALQATPAPPEFYSNNHGVRTRMPLSVHGANGARSDLVILIDGHGRTRRMDLARPPGARYKYTPPSPATKSGRAHRSGVGAARTQSSLDVCAAISKPEIGRKATGASPRQHPSLFPPPAGSAAIRKAELQNLPCRPFHLSFFFSKDLSSLLVLCRGVRLARSGRFPAPFLHALSEMMSTERATRLDN